MKTTIVIIVLVLVITYLIGKLVDKNKQIKRISKDRDNLAISFAFLDGITASYLPGPAISTLEKINSGVLSNFSNCLENFYYHKFFENENTVENIGEFLLDINDRISDEKRIDFIENILGNAMLKASPKFLAGAVAKILSDEQVDRGNVLKYLKSAKDFILRNLSPETIAPFIIEFDLRINEIIANNPDLNGEVISAHAILIKNDLKK